MTIQSTTKIWSIFLYFSF